MKKKSSKKAARRPTKAPARPARKKVSYIPKGFHTVTPYLVMRNTADAIAFYKRVFGAKELMRMPRPDGGIAHAEMQIGDSRLMLGDESPAEGARAPQSVGGTPVHIFLYVKDVDKTFAQATAAGAQTEMPPTDMFWGDRFAKLADPFGHKWSMATHTEDLTPKQMAKRAAEAMPNPQGA